MILIDVHERRRDVAREHVQGARYAPGNTDGVLDTLTEIAISQFQAERSMAVTGQPSAQLAAALAAETTRQR